MKCRQAVKLLNIYLDGRLQIGYTDSLQEHIKECKSCKNELEKRKALQNLIINVAAGINAPENFTESVMQAVEKIKVPAVRPGVEIERTVSYPVLRRLGASMLLTAAIMIFSMFIPPQFGGAINSFAAEGTTAITDKTNQLADTITDLDKAIKLFFKNIGHRFERIEEDRWYEL